MLVGRLKEEEGDWYIMTEQGIGYMVSIPAYMMKNIIGAEYYYIHHLFDNQGGQRLFAFRYNSERKLFIKLLSVNGVGPSTALSLMSAYFIEELIDIIQYGNIDSLIKIKGVGKKTAEKIILELGGSFVPREGGTLKVEEDAINALVSLGYKKSDAKEVVWKVMKSAKKDIEVQELVKECLRR